MEKLTLEAVYLHGQWCSPVVGTFYPCSIQFDKTQTVIGTVSHFGHTYDLVIPVSGVRIHSVFDKETSVEYGTPVAIPHEEVEQIQPKACEASDHIIRITAPCDGFLRIQNASGKPLRSPGEIIHSGDVLAVIEVMKLGVDILYENQSEAEFLSYEAENTVRQGEVVCTLKL